MSSKSVDLRANSLARKLIILGTTLLVISVTIFFLTFYPVIKEELAYQIHRSREKIVIVDQSGREYGPNKQVLEAVNTDFSIVIPKIAANAPVIANVDPFDSQVYQRKLTQGVAHAKGSSLPGQPGNTFLFAHSAGNFYEANRYNAVFYLLSKLENHDEIDIFYKDEKYTYRVTSKQIVEPDQVTFLHGNANSETLTLMTCWPAGTTLKRLIVKGVVVK